MRPFILFLYGTAIGLVSFIGNSDALSVCTRPNQSMSDGFFQRVDLPSAIACIERCIEYMEICHSALFIRFDEKLNGICQLYPINSEDSEEAFQEQDNPDAESTVFELLDRCPPITKMDMMRRLSEEALNRLAEPKKTARALTKTFDDEIIQREEIYPKRDSFTSSELAQYVKRDRSDRGYATMHSVDEPPNHRNPWQNPFESLTSAYSSKERPSYLTGYSSSSNEKDSPSYGPSPSLAGLSPIQPIQVLHRGQPMLHRPAIPPPLPTSFQSSYQQSSCQPGAPCVPTLHQLDKSPCPAKQGDPCAPKPPCSPDKYPEISCQLDPEWSEWTACSVTCGIGQRMRTCSEGL
ncbi:unnamed protein product, partial [Mesorhabditis belari]|uniref:Apple domain-containing protein n=1 Tax=Mesorhabditis belari TaxID=2138241 RepID=A0AAF3EEI0_9BILA